MRGRLHGRAHTWHLNRTMTNQVPACPCPHSAPWHRTQAFCSPRPTTFGGALANRPSKAHSALHGVHAHAAGQHSCAANALSHLRQNYGFKPVQDAVLMLPVRFTFQPGPLWCDVLAERALTEQLALSPTAPPALPPQAHVQARTKRTCEPTGPTSTAYYGTPCLQGKYCRTL